ncbi:hypothetical protein ABW20_dc0105514 [Dactylellina cionopaga]|nr:hypothetical protein ABW20_dc0105514 [Dactylellina cionopaga]
MDRRRPSHTDHVGTSSSQPSKRQKTFHYDSDDVVHEPGSGSPTAHDRYTVAWICAFHIEMAAARAMLDEVHDALAAHPNDSNNYILGSIRQHNIVIACLPNAQYGTNNAASVLTHLIRTFPSIRLGLMVGIGGGVPSMADIRLGDIVVGTRVMQYDLGKIVQDGAIRRTAVAKTPHMSFGTAVSALRAEHEWKPSRVPSILREKLGENTGYGRPSAPDQLFAATYEHISPTPECDKCEESKLVPRTTRVSRNPTIHYGVIASGNQVMRSGTTRDSVARQLEAICFEMEAAGLMDILPCLSIRGICDYSDSHKNKEWQKYAAATANAYARELLEVLPAAEAPTKASYVLNTCESILQFEDSSYCFSQSMQTKIHRMVVDSTSHAKTCRWFLSHLDYKAWLDPRRLEEHRGFLWIRGKPGAGKSTIMKFVYSQTKKKAHRTNAVVASFFFNARGEQLEKSIHGMYRSLLLQLLEGYPDLQAVFDDPDLVPQNQNDCPSLNVLRELFCNAVSGLGQRSFTCFVDALDECDEQQVRAMVQDLEDLADNSTEIGVSLRICFSSRHYPYIVIRQGIQLKLEDQPGHVEDLANYVESRLKIKDAALVKELRLQILEKAAGVFLWVALVVDILNKEDQLGRLAMRKRLAELPNDLSELFKDMLRRDQENMEYLLLCILWILCAKRPLRPEEYYHALWSGLSLKGLVDDEIPDVTGPDAIDTVASCVVSSSKGLAEITKSKQPTVQFIHESVRDFLVKDKGLYELWPDLGFDWENLSHERLKKCCNIYMNHAVVRASINRLVPTTKATGRTEISKEYPFLEYASQNVLSHANSAAVVVPQDDFLFGFLVPDWISINNLFEKFKVREYRPGASLLYILAERNLANLIRIHPQRESYYVTEGQRYGPPILAALALGSHEAVQAFLEAQARTQPAESPLHDLCKEYAKDENKCTPLGRSFNFLEQKGVFSYIENLGDEVLLMFLLNSGIDINLKDEKGQTPLNRLAIRGHEKFVTLVLEKGAGPDSKDNEGRTPLSYAVESGSDASASTRTLKIRMEGRHFHMQLSQEKM